MREYREPLVLPLKLLKVKEVGLEVFPKRVVHGCLDECPRIVCIDKCRADLEGCRKQGKGICEIQFNECESECEDIYSGNEEL
jgi:hypothetical protein